MMEDFITVSALISASVSVLAALRAWSSVSSARSDLVEKLVVHTEELKTKSITFSRDNDISQKEIETLNEMISKIQGDLARIQEQRARPAKSETSAGESSTR